MAADLRPIPRATMYSTLTLLAVFLFFYSSVAGRLQKTVVSGPMVYMAFGLAMGPLGLGWIETGRASRELELEVLRALAEVTLAFVLFTGAAAVDLRVLLRSTGVPARLLFIGLPLTVGAGYLLGTLLFPGIGALELAILATVLAPTDAALGAPVVSNPEVPDEVREGLDVESGLNDGISVPVFFLFLGLAVGEVIEGQQGRAALELFLKEIGIGLAVGVVLTLLGTWTLKRLSALGWVTSEWRQIPVIALSLACFAAAQTLHGSGFIACFTGGLLFSALAGQNHGEMLREASNLGELFALATWVFFGALVVGPAISYASLPVIGYALLSLTVVRILPVLACLVGSGLQLDTKLFMGWFGPRGLASIVFAVFYSAAKLPGSETIIAVIAWTVILSVFLHGLTANPLVRRYGARVTARNGAV